MYSVYMGDMNTANAKKQEGLLNPGIQGATVDRLTCTCSKCTLEAANHEYNNYSKQSIILTLSDYTQQQSKAAQQGTAPPTTDVQFHHQVALPPPTEYMYSVKVHSTRVFWSQSPPQRGPNTHISPGQQIPHSASTVATITKPAHCVLYIAVSVSLSKERIDYTHLHLPTCIYIAYRQIQHPPALLAPCREVPLYYN